MADDTFSIRKRHGDVVIKVDDGDSLQLLDAANGFTKHDILLH